MPASHLKKQTWILVVVAALLATTAIARAQTPNRSRAKQAAPKTLTPAQANRAFTDAVKQGDEFRQAGKFEEALLQYAIALQLRPKWAEGWWYVGTIFYEKDSYAEARNAFRNLVVIDPKRSLAWGMLGLCEFQTRDFEPAIISLQRARALGLSSN